MTNSPALVFGKYGPDSLKAAWWAVVSRFLLHGLVLSTWASRIPAIQSTLHLTNARLGFALLGTAIGSVVSIPATSRLISRFGSKKVTAWSTIALSVALLGPSLAFSQWSLFGALTLLGAAAGANDVSINAQGVAIEEAMASPTMSRFHAMFSIGGLTGAGMGAILASHGIDPRLHFLVLSVLFCAIAIATAPFLFHAKDSRRIHSEAPRFRKIPSVVFILALIGFCMFLSEGAIADWAGVYLKQGLGANEGLAAAAYAVFSTGMALMRLLGDAISKHLGAARTVRIGALSAVAGLIVALTASTPGFALPGFALTGAGFSVIVPLVFAAGGRASSNDSGRSIAMISGCGYVGFLFGPPLIGILAQASSLRIALLLLVALSLVAAALASAVQPPGRAAN